MKNSRRKRKELVREIINGKWFGMFKRILVFLSILILAGILIYAIYCNKEMSIPAIMTNTEILERICFVMEICGFFVASVGVVAAVMQYILSTKQEFKDFNNECVQKAIDLSGYYKDNILPRYSIIHEILSKSQICEIIDSVDSQKMREFDEYELNDLFGKKQIESIKECLDSDNFLIMVKDVCKKKGFEVNVDIPTGLKESEEREFYSLFLTYLVNDILNNMEYFAMYFTHKCADETVVYQSLHQTYLTTVKLLYYNIAVNNKQGADKFYSNVVELYNIWNGRYLMRKESFALGVRELVEKGNSADHA